MLIKVMTTRGASFAVLLLSPRSGERHIGIDHGALSQLDQPEAEEARRRRGSCSSYVDQ